MIVQPGKDGAVYLLDAEHLGTLYDRAPIMPGCGEGGGTCAATWAGTIAPSRRSPPSTAPTLALIPTFVDDDAHPAGLQALAIDTTGPAPRLVPRWQAPAAADPAALSGFRQPPSGVSVVQVDGEPYAALADTGSPSGALYWIRVRDGAIVDKLTLAGGGRALRRAARRETASSTFRLASTPARPASRRVRRCWRPSRSRASDIQC